jgi:hypothetical protein
VAKKENKSGNPEQSGRRDKRCMESRNEIGRYAQAGSDEEEWNWQPLKPGPLFILPGMKRD